MNSLLGAAALLVPLAAGQVRNCPSNSNNVCYSVAVPNSSGSSAYIQLSAPTSYAWVGLGTGSRMTGSSMFIMYTDGNGNVTVSPRRGSGHTMPTVDSSIEVQLLAGSGVSGNTMTANILCSNCANYFDLSSSSAGFIASWRSGNSIDSSSTSTSINQHDDTASWEFNLSQASISSDTNPYVSTSGSSSDNTGSNSGNSNDSSSNGNSGSGSGSGGSGSGNGSGSSSGSSGTGVVSGSSSSGSSGQSVLYAHALVASIAFVVLYPFGSILMPLLGKWYIHATFQMVSFLTMWIGFGLGIKLANDRDLLFKQAHTIMGTIVICALVLQPAMGYMHHRHYLQHKSRGIISYVHIWYGRTLMALGVVNGGLGLKLAGGSQAYKIAYAVVAAVMFVVYVIASITKSMKKSQDGHGEEKANKVNRQTSRREVYEGYQA